MSIEVVITAYRDGTLHPETWFVTFWDKEENFVRHVIEEGFNTACGKSFRGKLVASGLADPESITCPRCRQLLGGARLALAPPTKLAVAS